MTQNLCFANKVTGGVMKADCGETVEYESSDE